jgi:hypothetical protein
MHSVCEARAHPWWWWPWRDLELKGVAMGIGEDEDRPWGESHHALGMLHVQQLALKRPGEGD